MGLKHLKEQNPDLNFSLIDLISEFDPTKTKKITPLLLKALKNGIEKNVNDMYWVRNNEDSVTVEKLKQLSPLKMVVTNWMVNSFFWVETLDKIPLFVDYLERGLIENNDISKYEDLKDIMTEIGKAATKEMLKKSKKDIMVIHDDDEWLFFKPLTHDSAITYGFGTKWCTSMKNDPEYFYRYSNQGVLIYVINKKTNRKFGVHSNCEVKLGIYDEIDNPIDSFETGLPTDLIKKLFEWLDVKTNLINYHLFSEDEKNKSHKYYHRPELSKVSEEEISVEMPDLPGLIVETMAVNAEARILPINPMVERLRRIPRLVPRLVDNVDDVSDLFEDLP
jgi:hypothetical protein